MQREKGALQSLTVWGILVSLAGLVADKSGEIEALCNSVAPSSYAGFCGPVVALIVQLAGLLIAWRGRTRKGDIKGLWK